MPVVPPVNYPGVYITEVESGVHTITPVDTATTAFIGQALRGPVNQPVVINSFGDFQRIFGGLWLQSKLGYAVNQFFLNGGSKAIIVRVCHYENPEDDSEGKAQIEASGLPLIAKNRGAWGNSLHIEITHNPDPKIVDQLATRYTVKGGDLFNLTVTDEGTKLTECFNDLTVEAGPRRVDRVLEKDSTLIAFDLKKVKDVESLKYIKTVKENETRGEKEIADGKFEATRNSGIDSKGKLTVDDLIGDQSKKTGMYALENADIFNLLYIPPYNEGASVETKVLSEAITYCEKRRAFLLVDPPEDWDSKEKAAAGLPDGLTGNNAAIYFPHILVPNNLRDNQVEAFGPCGAVAGIIARTDATRGVWKAPAGLEAQLRGVVGLRVPLTDAENGLLNPLGINCLRQMPAAGNVVWGARTIAGDDRLASQWKYIPVRRTALYIEESLYRGTQWAVFEPNDEPLWSQLRLNIGVFMHGLFRQGAFQGQSPKDAYFVKCDRTTTEQADIDRGIVNIIVGFAPLKPAEFVILYIQQIAGQLAA